MDIDVLIARAETLSVYMDRDAVFATLVDAGVPAELAYLATAAAFV